MYIFKTKKNKLALKNQGFLLVEVIVISSIIVASVLAAMSVAQKSIYVSRQSLNINKAGFLLEEGAEVVRIIRDTSWDNVSSLTEGADYYPTFSGTSWSLSATPNTVGVFTRKVSVSSVMRDVSTSDIVSSGGTDDPGTKLITITTSWQEGGNPLSRTLSFYISDIF